MSQQTPEPPDNNADLAHLDIELPHVSFEDVSEPKEIEPYLLEYLRVEGFEPDVDSLEFIRTAEIGGTTYWIWRFLSDGDSCYGTATQTRDGSTGLGCAQDHWKLTPEQYIFGDYHGCF